MNKKKNIVIAIVFVLLLAIIVLIMIGLNRTNIDNRKNNNSTYKAENETTKTDNDTQSVSQESSDSMTGAETFAIFGVDSRSNQLDKGTRSDSIMIVEVNHDNKTVKIASVFRDCMMNIDGHGYQKVTHAHAFGGPKLAVQTLNENLDLDIKKYVTLNFSSVADIIDEVGGIVQDLDSQEVAEINGSITELNKIRGTNSSQIKSPGTYTLDGTQAVAYSRIRHAAGGDYKRAERQRTVLFKVFESAKQMSTTAKIKVVSDLIGEVNTNYETDDVLSIFKNLSEYTIEETTAYPQVFYGGTVDGAWVEVPTSLCDMATGIHKFLYGEENYTPSEKVTEYSNVMSGKVSGPNNNLTNADFNN